MHEEMSFTVKPKNFEQFKDHQSLAQDAKVDFEDTAIKVNVKIIADENCYFKLSQISRSEQDLVFDDVKKKVPNPALAELQ